MMHFRAALVRSLFLLFFLLFGLASGLTSAADSGPRLERADYVPGEILVRLAPDVQPQSMRDLLRESGARTLVPLIPSSPSIGLAAPTKLERWWRLELQAGRSVEQAIQRLLSHPSVEIAEPNFILRKRSAPNDPFFFEQWGHDNTGQSGGVPDVDIDWPEARLLFQSQVPTPEEIVVGVIDTGVAYDHEDLVGVTWSNPMGGPDFLGYDFDNDDADPDDDDGHGTHVGGTIAAGTDNGTGLAGIANPGGSAGVKLMVLKFLDDGGSGATDDAILAIQYAVANGAHVINASWGSLNYSQAMYDTLAVSPLLFVTAAGNDAADTDQVPHYPSSYPLENIISVAAHDRHDNIWPGSNTGASTVDLAAPGEEILGTVPIELPEFPDHYALMDDTSIAAPHVTGAAALLMAARPDLEPREIKQALIESVDPSSAFSGACLSGGRLNLEAALQRVLDGFEIFPPPHYLVEPAPFDWIELQGDPTADIFNLSDEEVRVGIPIGFPFPFYEEVFDTVSFSSNGYLFFGDNLPNLNDRVNTPLTQQEMIAPWWDDFDPTGGGTIYTKLVDPDRFVVEFSGFAHKEVPGSAVSFEVLLTATGEVYLQYQDVELQPGEVRNAGGEATVGIAGPGSETLFSFRQPSLADGLTLGFVSAAPATSQPPEVTIGLPTNGAVAQAGTPVLFDGTALDDLDGDITANLQWSSHLDGPIGSGGSFAAPLSAGVHSIVAVVTDSSGVSGSASATVLASAFPASSAGRVERLDLGREPNGDVTLEWTPSCAPDATNYAIYTGSIYDPTNYHPLFCNTQGEFTQTLPAAFPDDSFFIVVPRTPTHEGSYGLGIGLERVQGMPACGEQATAECPVTPSSPKLEMTLVVATDAWQTVPVDKTYENMVVVCTPNYDQTSPPLVTRVRDVTADSFDVRVQTTDGSPAPGTVDVHCLTAEEGVYTEAAHGITMEAARYVSTVTDLVGSWDGEVRPFYNTYSDPVVVGQVMTSNDSWSTFWCRGSNRGDPPSGILNLGKMVGEDPDSNRTSEEVGYVVFETGYGTVDGTFYSAALSSDTVLGIDDAPPYSLPVSGLPAGPAYGAVASQAGMNVDEGSWVVLFGSNPVTSTGLQVAIDEDQAQDTERKHTSEQIGYIIFED